MINTSQLRPYVLEFAQMAALLVGGVSGFVRRILSVILAHGALLGRRCSGLSSASTASKLPGKLSWCVAFFLGDSPL